MSGNRIVRVGIVGCGRKAQDDYIPALIAHPDFRVGGICDSDTEVLRSISGAHSVATYQNVSDMVEDAGLDGVVLALPHDEYRSAIEVACKAGLPILKEKPFALDLSEALWIQNVLRKTNVPLMLALQRSYHPFFQALQRICTAIGPIVSFNARYTLNISSLDQGWRSSKSRAGGGALLDMGYHIIDTIIRIVGLPKHVFSSLHYLSRKQNYDVEDTAHLVFHYESEDGVRGGQCLISRVYPREEEQFTFVGQRGMVECAGDRIEGAIQHYDMEGQCIEKITTDSPWGLAPREQLDTFYRVVNGSPLPEDKGCDAQMLRQATIEAAYRSATSKTLQNPQDILTEHGVE